MRFKYATFIAVLGLAGACVPASSTDSGVVPEADAAITDAPDAGALDAAADAGTADSGEVDAAVPDTGVADAGPSDSGPSLCPSAGNNQCEVVADCQDDLPPPTNCEPCRAYNRSICSEGQCSAPPLLSSQDLYTLVITVAPNVLGIESLATFAVSERTAGDRKLTCEDFLQDRVSLDNDCLNILDTRSFGLPQTGDTYAVSFGRFASGQRTLFLIYGHRGAQPRGERLGVSCTALDVPAPTGTGPYLISGEPMVLLP